MTPLALARWIRCHYATHVLRGGDLETLATLRPGSLVGKPQCPICEKTFKPGQRIVRTKMNHSRAIAFHVVCVGVLNEVAEPHLEYHTIRDTIIRTKEFFPDDLRRNAS